jgi:hypothetical protein
MFEVGKHLDGLRSRPSGRLEARRVELVRVQREARIEELDVLRVLDERGQIDVTVGCDGEFYALVGNPNRPDGLRLAHIHDLTADQAAQVGLPRRREKRGAA